VGGISVSLGENIDIIENTIINGDSISSIDCSNNNISLNILNGSSGLRLTRVNESLIWQNIVLFSERDGIRMLHSSRNHILQNIISNAEDGFDAFTITDNIIENNYFGHNIWDGISIDNSTGNMIIWNNITDNRIGISLGNSAQNTLHHNYFIMNDDQLSLFGNNENTWDDGQGEGNFWDDYPGFDNNGDGVGETDLPHLGVDNFPITSREGSDFDEALAFLIIYFVVLIITLIVVIYVYTKRKKKGDSEGGIEGVRPREL
jgi:parallel beta-helix repeat protein